MTNPLPLDATWTDHVNAHGGPGASGWWVTLRWYADSEHLRPEVVGRYPSWEQAVAAMEDSLLIDGFAGDTDRDDWLDDVYAAPDPALIARTCADYGHRVTLIDVGDPSHFGARAPEPAGYCLQRDCIRPEHCTHLAWMRAGLPPRASLPGPTASPLGQPCSGSPQSCPPRCPIWRRGGCFSGHVNDLSRPATGW